MGSLVYKERGRVACKGGAHNNTLNVDVWSSGNCMHSLPLIVAYNYLHSTRQLALRYEFSEI